MRDGVVLVLVWMPRADVAQAALNLLMREGFHSRKWDPPPDKDGGQQAG